MPAHPDLADVHDLLGRTPALLEAWLAGLPERWAHAREGPDTFSPLDVLGHLIHGERTDWLPRVRHILERGAEAPFEPFDRFAMRQVTTGRSLDELLREFARLRAANLAALEGLGLEEEDLELRGLHPELGSVTLGQLLASWVAHDLGHVAQIARVMAKRYREEVGPWRAYLTVVDRPPPGARH